MPMLPVIWAGIMAFVILAYVVLDGFDLGVGLLFPLERGAEERDVMVNTIAPVWDGNETWLVLGGAGLYGAFPLAYAIILPAFYPLVILMVLGLICRGVAFEFRFRADRASHRRFWDGSFFGGSLVAAFCQGVILGGLLQGVAVRDGAFHGAVFAWLRPFPLFCGLALLVGYAMLGAAWLCWRSEGALQARMRGHARRLGLAMLAVIGIVSAWSPLLNPDFFTRWFALPGLFATAIAPLAVLVLGIVYFSHLSPRARPDGGHDATPFLCALGLFVVSYLGLGYSIFPLIVPPSISIWQAASPPASQEFLLVGTAVLIPVIVLYNGFAYWVFRGKVKQGAHYH
ncbi:MAG: cytochrome d ubiquinol oxidase subunit II [Rhodospirillales bacterium]|nr:cytochrome d ubiquinol oxidase subunit II [Rhodospirillales bacterium]